MPPTLSENYAGNRVLIDPKFNPQSCLGLARCPSSPYGDDILFGKLSSLVLLATSMCSMNPPVLLVHALGGPTEIRKAIVCWVAIREVAGLHVFWPRANKRFENQYMNETKAGARVKENPKMSVTSL